MGKWGTGGNNEKSWSGNLLQNEVFICIGVRLFFQITITIYKLLECEGFDSLEVLQSADICTHVTIYYTIKPVYARQVLPSSTCI